MKRFLRGGIQMARKKFSDIEKDVMLSVSNNLKAIINEQGITQKNISEKTNLPTSTISDYINGRTLISPGNLELISVALGVNKSDIYPVEGNENALAGGQGRSDDEIDIEKLMQRKLVYKGHTLSE